MALWGAPTPNANHAADCVRAAVKAQRTIHWFNQERFRHNQEIKGKVSTARSLISCHWAQGSIREWEPSD